MKSPKKYGEMVEDAIIEENESGYDSTGSKSKLLDLKNNEQI